jgi:hypothetical protein
MGKRRPTSNESRRCRFDSSPPPLATTTKLGHFRRRYTVPMPTPNRWSASLNILVVVVVGTLLLAAIWRRFLDPAGWPYSLASNITYGLAAAAFVLALASVVMSRQRDTLGTHDP